MNITAISTNIRFENTADGDHNWPKRRSLLQELLLSHSPDFICTQEGKEPQLKNLESLLPGFTLIEENRPWITERMYPCIYFKKERFEVLNSGDFWLSETPEVAGSYDYQTAFPRLMTWAQIEEKKTNKVFYILNTHLDHVLEKTRIAQATVIKNVIQKHFNHQQPMIICGDFNSGPKGEVRRIFKDFRDPWHDFQLEEESSHHNFTGVNHQGERIDWVLHSTQFQAHSIFYVKDHRDGLYPSDHFPVVCKLSLT